MGQENSRVVAGLICEKDLSRIREAVCIQTEKIYDSCREKDCIENARVRDIKPIHRECNMNDIINRAFNVKIRKAVVKDVFTDVEPVPFRRGFFTVDVKFIIEVVLEFFTRETFPGGERIEVTPATGEISFDKRVILFGSEGNVRIFKTHFEPTECGPFHAKAAIEQDNMPIVKVEVADPIPLSAKVRDILDKLFEENECHERGQEGTDGTLTKRVFATVGLFVIIKLARLVQLLIPAFDFCVPHKECIASTEENPCELFETIEFPFEEFFPPQMFDFPGATEQELAMIHEMNEHKHHHHEHEEHHE